MQDSTSTSAKTIIWITNQISALISQNWASYAIAFTLAAKKNQKIEKSHVSASRTNQISSAASGDHLGRFHLALPSTALLRHRWFLHGRIPSLHQPSQIANPEPQPSISGYAAAEGPNLGQRESRWIGTREWWILDQWRIHRFMRRGKKVNFCCFFFLY